MPLFPLAERRSTPARLLAEPAPEGAELEALLQTAIRVPDHAQLVPFRLLLLRGAARARLGEVLAEIHARREPGLTKAQLDKDRGRFTRAPLVVTVIARIDAQHAKVPAQEQLLSAACVAYNLLLGAQELGYGAQWLTGWPAYDAEAATLLGLRADERVVAFVHLGTPQQAAAERRRPPLAEILGEWG